MDVPATRVCSKCSEEKALTNEYFNIQNQRGKTYFRRICKVCQSLYRKKWYAEHKEYELQRNREYIQSKIDQGIPFHEIEYQKYRTRKLDYRRKYAEDFPEKIQQTLKKYRDTHRQELIERGRKARQGNRQHFRTKDRQWRKNHPDRVRAKKNRRAVRIRGAQIIETISLEKLAERDNWKCHICGRKVTRKNWSRDHLIPISASGQHVWLNVALAHQSCNSLRGAGRLPAQLRLLA